MKNSILLTALGVVAVFVCRAESHPVPKNPLWLTFDGAAGPGKGKHVVIIAAEQEYRSEQSMPMMAAILGARHGFDTTVLFSVNPDGLVDPTMPTDPPKGKEAEFKGHNVPGLEHLASADLMILFNRHLTLPAQQMSRIVDYLDSGKPFIALRTANHGFRGPIPYEIDGKQVRLGDIVGGAFMSHHGNWHQDSTRGDIVEAMKDHPVLTGVKDIWGPSDVYRTYKEGGSLPEGCTALVLGQPLIGRKQGGADNPKKEPLPVVWIKTWKTSKGQSARVLHSTMGSAADFESPGLRRLIINGVYWGIGMEDKISPDSSVDYMGEYKPLDTGFDYGNLGVSAHPPEFYRPK